MDKIFFWRDKEPELPVSDQPIDMSLGKDRDLGLEGLDQGQDFNQPPQQLMPGQPQMPSPPSPEQQKPLHQEFAQPPAQISSVEKDVQILSAKMDSLKAILDNINQRLANIERIANESQKYERY